MTAGIFHELLLPRTDEGVYVQLALWAVTLPVAVFAVRRHHEVRLFVIGLYVFALAIFGLRSVH